MDTIRRGTAPRWRRRLLGAAALAGTLAVAAPVLPAGADPKPAAVTGPTLAVPASPDDPIAKLARTEAQVNTTSFDLLAADAELARRRTLEQRAGAARDAATAVVARRQTGVAAAADVVRNHKLTVSAQRRGLRMLALESFVAGKDTNLEDMRAVLAGDATDQHGRTLLLTDQVIEHEGAKLRTEQRGLRDAERALRRASAALATARAD
ncbi:MAG: hypothetical protein JWM05_2602, partial [Acidimicrobiales bacterium]|nr:hypothetical protein [Acidimicrobiales bacterium]